MATLSPTRVQHLLRVGAAVDALAAIVARETQISATRRETQEGPRCGPDDRSDMNETGWYKSSFSGPNTDACVEVLNTPEGGAQIRDSKDHGTGPVLSFNAAEWDAFRAGVAAGEFGPVNA